MVLYFERFSIDHSIFETSALLLRGARFTSKILSLKFGWNPSRWIPADLATTAMVQTFFGKPYICRVDTGKSLEKTWTVYAESEYLRWWIMAFIALSYDACKSWRCNIQILALSCKSAKKTNNSFFKIFLFCAQLMNPWYASTTWYSCWLCNDSIPSTVLF